MSFENQTESSFWPFPSALRSISCLSWAEREGFEPSRQFYPPNTLAPCRFRPLSHLSLLVHRTLMARSFQCPHDELADYPHECPYRDIQRHILFQPKLLFEMPIVLYFLDDNVEDVPPDTQVCFEKRYEVLAVIGENPNTILKSEKSKSFHGSAQLYACALVLFRYVENN